MIQQKPIVASPSASSQQPGQLPAVGQNLLEFDTLLRNSAASAAAEMLDEWEQNCLDMDQLEASSQKAVRVHLWSRDSIRVCNCTTQTLTDQAVDDAPSSRYDELFLPKSDQQNSIRIDLSSTNNNTKLYS